MTLLQRSITGGIFILAILVLRGLTLNHLLKKTFLVLWWAALARLLLPFSVTFRFSLYSLLNSSTQTVVEGGAAGVDFAGPIPSPALSVESIPAGPSIWEGIWLVGALVCGVFFVRTYWRCLQEFRMSLPIDHPFCEDWLKRHPGRRKISIRQSGAVGAPLTFGILHPVILLPKSMDLEEEQELDYVLTHESVHIRRWDAVTKLVILAAVCLHWFNPLVWVLYVLANQDLELSCDETVLHLLGEEQRSAYARTLIHLEETRGEPSPICSHFSKNALEERITAIMKTKRFSAVTIALSVLLAVGTTMVFATSSRLDADTVYSVEEGGGDSPIEWWTAEEYEDWMQQQKRELESLVDSGSGWHDGKGRFHLYTQETARQQMADYEKTLQEIKQGKRYAKPIDSDGDGELDLMLAQLGEPQISARVELDTAEETAGLPDGQTQRIGAAASEDFSQEAMESFAKEMKQYEKWGITYTPEDGGNVYYQGRRIRRFVDENPNGDVLMVSSQKHGKGTLRTIYDENGEIQGVQEDSNLA